jgi:hypothetical protein
VFGYQQQGDQIATDDEENLNPKKATGEPGRVGVIDDDRDHGKGPQAIETREVRNSAYLSCFLCR